MGYCCFSRKSQPCSRACRPRTSASRSFRTPTRSSQTVCTTLRPVPTPTPDPFVAPVLNVLSVTPATPTCNQLFTIRGSAVGDQFQYNQWGSVTPTLEFEIRTDEQYPYRRFGVNETLESGSLTNGTWSATFQINGNSCNVFRGTLIATLWTQGYYGSGCTITCGYESSNFYFTFDE